MQNPLGYEKESSLLKKFAIPSIISMLVSSLYNIVDQIFIGQGVGFSRKCCNQCSFSIDNNCTCDCIVDWDWFSKFI